MKSLNSGRGGDLKRKRGKIVTWKCSSLTSSIITKRAFRVQVLNTDSQRPRTSHTCGTALTQNVVFPLLPDPAPGCPQPSPLLMTPVTAFLQCLRENSDVKTHRPFEAVMSTLCECKERASKTLSRWDLRFGSVKARILNLSWFSLLLASFSASELTALLGF